MFSAEEKYIHDICVCVHANTSVYVDVCWGIVCACYKLCKEGKKAGLLKCHITQHGNYFHDMRCVSPHHHRPLSMCRTGPQTSTCAQKMHEEYTGMSLYRSPRVGNATLITLLFSLSHWAPSSPRLFSLLSLVFALYCPSAIKSFTASQEWLLMTSVWMKPLPRVFETVSVLNFALPSIRDQVWLPKCFASSHMMEGKLAVLRWVCLHRSCSSHSFRKANVVKVTFHFRAIRLCFSEPIPFD